MAAVSLFRDTNMAAVTSCENTLYGGANCLQMLSCSFSVCSLSLLFILFLCFLNDAFFHSFTLPSVQSKSCPIARG